MYLLINPRWRRLALGLFFAAYFAYFSWSGLEAHFAPDDVMNIHVYWFPTPWRVLLSQFTVWQGVYRPMGAAFYLPLLYCFGWNPVPYHIAQSTIILAAVFLVYHFARTLDCSESVAAVAAIIVSYHAGLSNLYFNTSFVYDVLCGFFCLATFVYYLRVSEWKPRNLAVFLLLFLCALNSKEMAATLPPLLLIYEWLYHHRLNRTRIAPIAAATLLTLAFAYGRLFAPGALASGEGYHLVFSWQRFIDFQVRELGDLFLTWDYFRPRAVAIFWAVTTYLAWRRPRPVLRFCWFYMLLAPLPIEFLEGRGSAALYVPLFGIAIFAATVFRDLVRVLAVCWSREPFLWRLGRRGIALLLTGAGVFLWAKDNRFLETSYVNPVIPQLGRRTWDVIQQLEHMHPKIEPNCRVVFVDDPFVDWDMFFIAALTFRDRSVVIQLNRKTPLTREEIATATHAFTFKRQRLVQLW